MRFTLTWFCKMGLLAFANVLIAGGASAEAEERSAVLDYVKLLIERAPRPDAISYRIDPGLGHPEAFHLQREEGNVRVTAGGAPGALYGVQEALSAHSVVGAEGKPDFDLRGAVLMMLSASWAYQSDLSPEFYPWFFDRVLMTRYLDYLLSARLNTLVIWSGHLFPHILELPEYPDASQFNREEIRRNQEQFRWLAAECARRNITILTHFYNIHISEHQAKALGRTGDESTRYRVPDTFVRKYYQTILARYFEEFPNVGLYICPGESLDLDQQEGWFRDVIFKAARDSGKDPKLIIRDWTLDPGFKKALPALYDNLYSELKHNDETITSPWPDLKHREWKGVLKGHIINLHDPADATPYRVGSPRLIGEMIQRWKAEGFFKGAWFYPPQVWSWPGTLDIATDGNSRATPLVAFERDELWHLLEGRYLWKADREIADEQAWAGAWLGEKFGDRQIGDRLVEWYDLTGPILPGLQNLTAIRFGNFFPVSIAWVQATIDDILSFRTQIDDPRFQGPTGLTEQRYYSRPIDAYTLDLYRARHRNSGEWKDLRSLPVAQLAEQIASGQLEDGYVRPDWLIDLYLEMAQTSLTQAREATTRGGRDPAELRRFVQDSQCLVYTVEYYRHKILAALEKRLFVKTKASMHAKAFKDHLTASVETYRKMFTYARQYYRAGTGMFHAQTWEATFENKVKGDYDLQMKWLESQFVK
jgi:hypothetical protein